MNLTLKINVLLKDTSGNYNMNVSCMKKVVSRVIISVLLHTIFIGVSFSQSRELLIKAGYIEKFTHFVQWPEKGGDGASSGKFIIAVIGDNKIYSSLLEIFSKSESKNADVEIVEIKTPEEIEKCQLLFISGSEKNNLDRILMSASSKPILTISDTKGFCEKGVIINMFKEGDYIRYEINHLSLDRSGLKINSLLLNYAVIK
jgi:hypothetical protein